MHFLVRSRRNAQVTIRLFGGGVGLFGITATGAFDKLRRASHASESPR